MEDISENMYDISEHYGHYEITLPNADNKLHAINHILEKSLNDEKCSKNLTDPLDKVLYNKGQDSILLAKLGQNIRVVDNYVQRLNIPETLLNKYIDDKKNDIVLLNEIAVAGDNILDDNKFDPINAILEKYFNDTYYKPTESNADRDKNGLVEDLQIVRELIKIISNDIIYDIGLLSDNKIDVFINKCNNDIKLLKILRHKLNEMVIVRMMYSDY
jgi:hypothetical protein